MGKVNSMQMGEINLGSYKFWGDGIWTEENSGSYTPSSYAYVAQDAVFGFGFWDVDQVTADPQKLQAFTGTISTPVQAAYDKPAGTYASNITFAIFNTGATGEASIESSIDLSKSANNVFAVGMYQEGTTPYFTEYDVVDAYSNVIVKAGANVKVGADGYVWVGSAYDSKYDTQAEYKNARFVLTVEGEVYSDDNVRVGNTGSLIVQNGGYVEAGTFVVRGDVTIKDGGEVSARYINVYGEDWADDANATVNYATITVQDAALNLYEVAGENNGTFQIGHASNVNRGGKLILDDATLTMPGELIVTANGLVEMSGASSIQVGDINAAAGQNWLSITIDAADAKAIVDAAAAGEYAYLVNQTGNDAFDAAWVTINGNAYANGMEVAPGYYLAISDNDLVITDEYIDVLYVNNNYSEGNADGHIFGYNAFETMFDGIYKYRDYEGHLTVKLMDDTVIESGWTMDLLGWYTIENGTTNDIATLKLAYDYAIGGAVGYTMTVEEGVLVEGGYLYSLNGTTVINGEANVNQVQLFHAPAGAFESDAVAALTVNGKVTTTGLLVENQSEINVNEKAEFIVNGDAKFKQLLPGETNTVNFTGATVKFNGGLDYAAGTMTARKTDMDVVGKFAIADNAAVLIEEGTEVEVAGDIANEGGIKVSNATLRAKNVENAGDITAANAKITFASLAGNGSFNVETTVVTVEGNVNSTISATAKSDVTVKGDFNADFASVKDSSFKVAGSFTGDAAVSGSTFAVGKDFNGDATITDSTFAVAGNFSGEATVEDSTFAVETADGSVKLAGDIVIAGDFTAADIAITSKVNMSVVAGKTYTDDELFGATDVAYGAGKFVITAADDAAFGGVITVDAAAETEMTIETLTLSGIESFVADENVVTVEKIELSDVLFNRNGVTIGEGFASVDQVCIDNVCYNVGAARDTTTGLQFTLNDGVLTANKILNIFDAKDGGAKTVKLDGADYYGSNMETVTEVKAMNISNVTVDGLGKDDASTRVFGGSMIVEGYYAAGLDITSVTVTDSGIAYQVYGGSNVQGGTYAGTVNTAVTIDSDYGFGTVVGGSRVENARMNVIGDSSVSLDGGSYKLVVGASLIGKGGDASMMGNSDVTISGDATVNGSVYGGGFVQSTGKYQQIGSTNVTIEGSTVTKNIYGGHAGASTSKFDATLVGSTYITINNSTIGGNVFGGSYNLGSITGTTNIAISGNSDVAGFINGDSSNAIYYGVESCVSGLRNLTFDGFTASAFNATEIVNIDNIAFVNNSDVNFANADIFDGAEILDWTFEDGSSIAGAGVLDFEGSTLHVKEVFDADLEDWTLVAAGEIKNFDKLEGAFAVNGTNQAMTWNGVDAYELTYAGTDYKLFQEGNSIKFTATLA
ncbi:MAG: hypothetical protein IKB16_14475 [Lentisphaeria bacterium]|nr:hypothetical protein [Lentisphaeria bacterium]